MDTYDPSWFQKLREVEERHFWFRARNDVIAASLLRWLPACSVSHPTRILEIGCGNGNVLRVLRNVVDREAIVIGLDLFREALRNAAARLRAAWVQGDVLALPFGQVFDVVGMFDVLEHLPDDRSVLESVINVLRPGGRVILTVPANRRLWSYFDVLACHQRRYGKGELRRKLTESGFDIEFLGYYMALIFPFVLLRRFLARGTRSGAIQPAELDLKVFPVLNELLFYSLRTEWQLLGGKGLPFGTSLLAVVSRQGHQN